MLMNALPNIAMTCLSDWQQAQSLMVNNSQKVFPSQTTVAFGGHVYPAELVTKTAQLEREVARQRQTLEEK